MRVHVVLAAVPVNVGREDQLARVGKLHRVRRLRDQVLTPPAKVVRGRITALPIIVRYALHQNQPSRAMTEQVAAEPSGSEAPVGSRTAAAPEGVVRLIEQICTHDVGRRAVPGCEDLPGFPERRLLALSALALPVWFAP